MRIEPITTDNALEVNEWLKTTGGGALRPGWVGFIWRGQDGNILACFKHAQTTVATFHADPDAEGMQTIRAIRFSKDFCRLGMPEVLVTCDRKSPLFEIAKKELRDVSETTAFLRLKGESNV